MTLPSSEPLPNNINELPPARQRHIRRRPRSASLAERQILLDSLITLVAPKLNFFLLSLLGAVLIFTSLYFNEPVILIAAAVIYPFLKPVFGVALFPATHKVSSVLNALISLLITLTLTIAAGALAGWLTTATQVTMRGLLIRFSSPYWLDLVLVGFSSFLSVLILLRQGQLPRKIGVILSFEILVPLAASGMGLIVGDSQLWPGALIIGLLHLLVSIAVASLSLILFGLPPKKAVGWLLILIPLGLALALLAGARMTGMPNFNWHTSVRSASPSPTSILIKTPSQTPSPKAIASSTPLPAEATSTNTRTPSQSPTKSSTPTQTPTAEPTSYWAIIDALTGAVIRESPDFEAPVAGYVNNGDQIEILNEITPEGSAQWYYVRTNSGETGWMLGSLVNTQTPTPAED